MLVYPFEHPDNRLFILRGGHAPAPIFKRRHRRFANTDKGATCLAPDQGALIGKKFYKGLNQPGLPRLDPWQNERGHRVRVARIVLPRTNLR